MLVPGKCTPRKDMAPWRMEYFAGIVDIKKQLTSSTSSLIKRYSYLVIIKHCLNVLVFPPKNHLSQNQYTQQIELVLAVIDLIQIQKGKVMSDVQEDDIVIKRKVRPRRKMPRKKKRPSINIPPHGFLHVHGPQR